MDGRVFFFIGVAPIAKNSSSSSSSNLKTTMLRPFFALLFVSFRFVMLMLCYVMFGFCIFCHLDLVYSFFVYVQTALVCSIEFLPSR